MINAIVNGAEGHMGKIVRSMLENSPDFAFAAGVDKVNAGGEILSSIWEFDGRADILIDFSYHTSAPGILKWAVQTKTPAIIATTGHDESEKAAIREASEKIPVFWSATMSVGIAFLCETAKRAAALFPNADIEIVESHHNRKADAPSGTALLIADKIAETRTGAEIIKGRAGESKRGENEIGISSLRLGNLPGTHEVIICDGVQSITLRHEVYDRAMFAEGALSAARFLVTKPAGLYNMFDMTGE